MFLSPLKLHMRLIIYELYFNLTNKCWLVHGREYSYTVNMGSGGGKITFKSNLTKKSLIPNYINMK